MAQPLELNNPFPDIVESDRLYARAAGLIPAGTQTLAKGPGQYVRGIAPKYALRGKGCRIWDVDGNEYIDWNMGVGPLVLGYAYPRIDEAIRRQLEQGITFSLMHPLEVEVAERIHKVVPCAESIRYSKTGADVASAAVRLARAFTGGDRVFCCGYHGWHDFSIAVTDRNRGIPSAVQNISFTFNYNDLSSLEDSLDDETAAVILEPTVFEEPREDFLRGIAELCRAHGVLLIFDEMWTGFRMALGGAQEYFGVVPDLAVFSKAVSNGMPLSVLAGRRDVMSLLEKEVFFFTTFGGEALSLAAAAATIDELAEKDVPRYLREKGQLLKDGYNKIAADLGLDYTRCIGYGYRSLVVFDAAAGDPLLLKSYVQQEMIRSGFLWSGFHTMSFSHTDKEIEGTLSAYKRVLPLLARAVEANTLKTVLRGEPVEPVFRKTSQFDTKPGRRRTRE
jgi:glutamate-1-semialdehyde aminotransferase